MMLCRVCKDRRCTEQNHREMHDHRVLAALVGTEPASAGLPAARGQRGAPRATPETSGDHSCGCGAPGSSAAAPAESPSPLLPRSSQPVLQLEATENGGREPSGSTRVDAAAVVAAACSGAAWLRLALGVGRGAVPAGRLCWPDWCMECVPAACAAGSVQYGSWRSVRADAGGKVSTRAGLFTRVLDTASEKMPAVAAAADVWCCW